MNKIYSLLVTLLLTAITANAQISGTVFKDFDNDGVFDNTATSFPYEKGAPNVIVNVYNAANALVATTTTGATGTYNFTAGAVPAGSYRVEFVTPGGLHNGVGSNAAATSSNTDIQFVTAPALTVNYGIASGEWYVTSNNPFIATNVISAGNPSIAGTSATRDNLFVLPYSLPATAGVGAFDPAQAQREAHSTLGSVFGLTYQKSTNTLLNSAYYKRHVAFGPSGIDAIYKTQVTAGNPAVPSLLVKLSTIGINVGADTRSTTVGNPNYIPPASNGISQDQDAFANIAKRGIGDIDLSEDGRNLYIVNLFENKLHRLNVGTPLKTSFVAGDVTSWVIPNPTGIGSLTWHPFGLKAAYGKVYVGGVMVKEQTTNHNLATDTVGQRGVVYEFDPATGTFTEVLRFPLTYRRGFANSDTRFPTRNNYWCAWQNNGDGSATGPLQNGYNTGFNPTFNGGTYYPQPMLADIEFTDDNQMLIGMRDRFGDQMGYQQPDINGFPGGAEFGSVAIKFRGLNSGDNLIAGKDLTGTGWTLENRGQVTNYGVTSGTLDGIYPVGTQAITSTGPVTSWTGNAGFPYGIGGAGASGAYGPGSGFGASTYTSPGGPAPGNNQGGYYLNNHNFSVNAANSGENGLDGATTLNGDPLAANLAIAAHFNKGDGGMAVVHGTNEYIFTLMDPVNNTFTSGLERMVVNTNGAAINGNMVQRLELTPFVANDPSNMGKANAMGDVEVLTPYQPIEVGNRIWTDANGNGIQDPGAAEAGLNGVVVELVIPGPDGILGNGDDIVVATTTTATIAGQPGSYFFNTLTTEDTRKATANLPGVPANNILPGFDYQVRVATGQAALIGLSLTKSNTAANSADNIDNDGVLSGTNAVATFNTNNNNHSFDFGFKSLASIGDKVWLDNGVGAGVANDGIQNGTEPGVAGVTVTLYQNGPDGLPGTADDIVLGTTVTDAFGNYLFDNLAPSTSAATSYNVGFTLPANHQFTTQTNTQVTGTSNATNTTTTTGGSTAANGSDASTTTGRTGSFWLAAGEAERGADAGLIFSTPTQPNSIGDKVWFDTDGDGVQDTNEPGVAGVTVTLYAANGTTVIATTITDANGNYSFTNLPPNTDYIIGVTPPPGTVFTTSGGTTPGTNTDSDVNPATGKTNVVVNSGVAGTQITGIDAGIKSQPAGTASLGDKVWNDLNSNGTQDVNEPGIAGVTVNLYQDLNGDGVLTGGETTPYATAVTDAFGNYIFNGLPVTASNKWQVEFVQPAGYNNTPVLNNNSGGDQTDSDITDNATDRTAFIRLKADERNMSVDAGFVLASPPGALKLGDKVWRDDDADGQQDATEPGVPGVTVKLFQNGPDGLPGTADDVLVGTTSTDVNGNYIFTNLAASTGATTNYNVQFSNIPANFVFTTQDAGADATDSDVNSLGKTGSINLTADNLTIDAGIKQGTASGLGSIGNRVWVDLGATPNGIQDAGEPGVAGVTVTLRDAGPDGIVGNGDDGLTKTTVTNALGEYLFTGLPSSNYVVDFSTLPAGYGLTTQNAGTDDNVDSDGGALGTGGAAAGTSRTAVIALGVGEDNLSVDLGLTQPAGKNTLGNKVWWDQNANGTQDGTEPGLAGVVVTLVNASGQFIDVNGTIVTTPVTTTTDANGQYLFTGLADGNFAVKFSNLPAGFDFTTRETNVPGTDIAGSDADRVSGITGVVALNFAAGGTQRDNRSLDAGIVSTRAALGNRVWDDLDGDGIQDAGEPGVAGVQVILYAADGTTVLGSTITDQNGNYLFANLNAGTYVVGVNAATLPTGTQFTQTNTPGDNGDNTNSDVATSGATIGKTASIVLAAGEVDLTIDAGIRRTPVASIGNRVWDDLNGDGIQDAGEPGIAGVVATLFNSANQPIGSAVTDGNGNWLITNVPPGTGYYVQFSNPPAGAYTTQDNGGPGTGGGTDTDTDSDVNSSGTTGTFDVTVNTVNLRIDAGIRSSLALPSKFISFTAAKQNNSSVLNFVIGQGAPSSTFTIEQSTNSVSFTVIGTVAGTNATSYNYTDVAPNLSAKNYYRIKEVEANGQVSYSEIRFVKFGKDVKVEVYPVPASSNLNITITEELINKPIVISMYNATGQEVVRTSVSKASGTETIDVSQLASGVYQLRVSNTKQVVAERKVMIVH
jgi:SdrD B-like domain/Secretion system C-terminal sorting domain